ncbi:MAG TPA: type I restriction enzyme HsdR N-terminal domain-containing protein [Chitinophagaceae bacterium]
MINIHFPEPSFRRKKESGKEYIFDPLRKKWLLLTPEEWVRQNFVRYLIEVMQYPSALIALEKEIWLGELKKRFDVLVYNRDHQPWMIIECKAETVTLNEETLQQALRYNITVPAEILVITNGNYTFGWQKKEGRLHMINELPEWA